MHNTPKIYIAGHRGMAGSAILRHLLKADSSSLSTQHSALITEESTQHSVLDPLQLVLRTHAELDLTDQSAVRAFFESEKPDQVYLAAAKVGGIHANNTYPAEFIYRNLMMEANVIHEAWRVGVNKLLFLGSSCIYPKQAPQPMQESALLTGVLEPTNEPYAIAKIAGIKLCESYNRQYGTDYRSVMPTNLYGPGDNYHPENSHVIPALIRRFHEAKIADAPSVTIWGSGKPRREFLYVDDMAAACVHVMNLEKTIYDTFTEPMLSHINVGAGEDLTIRELADAIAETVDYKGTINLDPSKPDGTPRKLMDSTRLNNLGWQAKTGLEEGLKSAYADFLESAYAKVLSAEC